MHNLPEPPRAPKRPHERTVFGETVTDEWFYLRDREDAATIPYLEAENRYTEEVMRPLSSLETTLYDEMVGRIQETDVSVPYPKGAYEYYSRTEQGKQYHVSCRRAFGSGPEEVLIDCNALAEGETYFSLGFERISPDGNILAYATDTDGSEVYTLRFKDLRSGALLDEAVAGVYYSAAWDASGESFFYTTLDETKRPYRVWRHVLGLSPDTLVFEEPDGRFNVNVAKCRSGRFIFLTADSITTTEIRYLEASRPAVEPKLLAARRHDIEYAVEHQGDWFYIRINDHGKNFRLARAPVADPSPATWEEITPHRLDATLERVEAFEEHLVVIERREALRRVLITRVASGEHHEIAFDEPVYTLFLDHNEEYASAKLRFVYTSLTTPRSVFDYDMTARERELKKRYAVHGYDPTLYASERIAAISHDGTRVPISLVYRKGAPLDGTSPLYLYGYGSYGIVTEPAFSSERVSLLDRGVIFAVAHIRGSGDLGRLWYEDGKLLHKKNTFFDFIACAEHLIAERYTSADRMAIAGGSAGGLLMGATINLRPDLFRVVVAHVPFVDAVNTMLDPTLPLTIIEYEEWGNPNVREFFDYIRSYAPYENVRAVDYPAILITAGLNDPRVPYWEPAKWVAKLRDCKTGDKRIVLRSVMGAGHGGPSGRYQKLREKAFEYAFVLNELAAETPRVPGLPRGDG